MRREPEDRPFTLALTAWIGGEPMVGPGLEHTQPLAEYLRRTLRRPARILQFPAYAAIVTGLRSGDVDAAMMGTVAVRRAEEDGGIEALVAPIGADGGLAGYQSAIFTRIDSGIHTLTAVRGAAVGLVEEGSASGYLVPRAMLRETGIDPDRDLKVRLFGSHLAVVEAVLRGDIAIGAVHAAMVAPPWLERGADYARLRVLARSQPIPPGPMVVRTGLPDAERAQLAAAMLRVHEDDPAAARVLIAGGIRFTLAERRSTPTLKSIAALSGVSYSTVSRVVNGVGGVAPEKAARVAAIVKELGYRPDGRAVSMLGLRPPVVGLLAPNATDAAFERLAATLQTSLTSAGVPLVQCRVPEALGEELFVELLLDGRLGALIATAAHANDPDLLEAARTGRPVVAVGVAHAAPGMVQATPDDAPHVVLALLGLA